MSPARLHALHAIDRRDLPGWPANGLPRLRSIALTDSRDVDLSERIVVGVMKHLLTLRFLISHLSGRPIDRVDPAVQKILAVALEQMRSLDRVPVHAIVDDAVEMTRRIGPRGASGFVNAILRKAGPTRCKLTLAAERDAAIRAERDESFPREVFQRLVKLYGEARAVELCAGFNREPPTLARLIGDAKLEHVTALDVKAVPHASSGVVVLQDARREALHRLAEAGVAQVQDATSIATVADLRIAAGQRVLDRCCGRGTKTRQILEALGGSGEVVAMDTSLDRLASLRAAFGNAISAGRLRVVPGAAIGAAGVNGLFDRILVDAPCSNSGVFSRRPEARYRQSPRELRSIATLQREILEDSLGHLASGGLLVYATCSIWPEENEQIVQQALRGKDGFELMRSRSVEPNPDIDPTQYRDGGFAATIRRN